MNLKAEFFKKRRPGATFAGVFSVALSSVLLLCGAGLTPTGNVQTSDINANGFNLTNAATVSAANVVATNSLTVPTGFFSTNNVVQTSGSYANPSWITGLAWSKLSGTPTNLSGYGITNSVEPGLGNPASNGDVLSSTTGGTRSWVAPPSGYAPFTKKTASFTALAGGVYGMDTTSGSVTATPPASPNDGDWFVVFDVAKKWATNQAVVGSSGNNFIDTTHTSSTAGPYNLNAIPYVGQGMVRFVWVASSSTWSVQ